jgi:hypothetical protein
MRRADGSFWSPLSFLSPITPVNPLNYIPSYDPLIDKLMKKFGPITPPLEVGSAILAPGQRKPQHEAQSQSQSRASSTNSNDARNNGASWKELLEQAAQKYTETTGGLEAGNTGTGSIPMEPFLAVAGTALIAALGKRGRGAGGEEEGSDEFTDASEDSRMAIDGQSQGGEDRKPKKKKRNRKGRVGH